MARGASDYQRILSEIAGLIDHARRTAARSVNAVLTATYWAVGRRIVEHEQHGARRAGYGEELVANALAIGQTPSGEFTIELICGRFRLPWSHYVRLLSVANVDARHFYEAEALRGGWTVRQLDRQISSQFYERTALSREHWMVPGENPPVGLILCASKDAAVVRYALDGLPNKVLAAEYRTTLPDEQVLATEITRTRHELEARHPPPPPKRGRKRVSSAR